MNIPCAKAVQPQWKAGTFGVLGYAIVFCLGIGFMAVLQTAVPPSQANARAPKVVAGIDASRTHADGQVSTTEGGTFEYMRLPLEEPKDFLPNTTVPLRRPEWVFDGYNRAQFGKLLNSVFLTDNQRRALVEAAEVRSSAVVVSPPPDVVLEMPRSAREKIYSVLSQSPANSAQCHPFRFRLDGFDQWCAEAKLSEESLQVLRKLTYRQGGSLCFCDGAIAQALLPPDEFYHFVKSLYRERTFIMRLLITPQTDIASILRYWRKGGRVDAIRPLLESMTKIPGGAGLNISFLLPTFAEVRLYTYADATKDPDVPKQNCFWTAMNFFNEKPDARFSSAGHARQALADEYLQVQGRAAYGDVVVLENAAGTPLHMCVYLADDVVFTKNGGDYMQPWVLMKIPDMLAYYDAHERVQMRLYRSKKDS